MSAHFYVGQKVVCVNNAPIAGAGNMHLEMLCPCQTYTVASLPQGDCPGIHLTEVRIKHAGYRLDRFRPLDERKTDISVFTRLLEPADRERAEA